MKELNLPDSLFKAYISLIYRHSSPEIEFSGPLYGNFFFDN